MEKYYQWVVVRYPVGKYEENEAWSGGEWDYGDVGLALNNKLESLGDPRIPRWAEGDTPPNIKGVDAGNVVEWLTYTYNGWVTEWQTSEHSDSRWAPTPRSKVVSS